MTSPAPYAPASPPGLLRTGEVPALEGLRALSVLIVMLSHSGLQDLVPGALGVTIFFFISGFIITTLLYREMGRAGTVDVSRFYARRALRLYPALVVFVIGATLLHAPERGIPSPLAFSAAGLYFVNYLTVFAPDRLPHNFGHLWSLAVEMHFYLLFPFLFVWLARTPQRLIAALVTICVLAPLVRIAGWRLLAPADAQAAIEYTSVATECRVDSIAIGAIVAILAFHDPDETRLRRLSRPPLVAAGLLLVLLTLVWRNEGFRETLRFSVQGLALVPLILACVLAPPQSLVSRALRSPAVLLVGAMSYALYLWHTAAFDFARLHLGEANVPLAIAVGWAATFLLAALSTFLIERPLIGLRRRLGSERTHDAETARRAFATPTVVPIAR